MAFLRISHDPAVMGGKPYIRGLRIAVSAAACAGGKVCTSGMKRNPRPCTVLITTCRVPSSPTAWRAERTRLEMLASETARPPQDRRNDLILPDHAVAVPDEEDQKEKHLRLQPHRLTAAAELKLFGVELEVSEYLS